MPDSLDDPSNGNAAEEVATVATGAEELAASFAEAFAPLLKRQATRSELCLARVKEFLATDDPLIEYFAFREIDVPGALRALSRWCNLDGVGPAQAVTFQVHHRLAGDDPDEFPVYQTIEVGEGRKERALVRGTLFVEGHGERVAVHVKLHHDVMSDLFTVDFVLPPTQPPETCRLLAEFRQAVDEFDLSRGRHVVFDRSGMRYLEPSGVTWDDVVLPQAISQEISRNTVEFLAARSTGTSPHLPPQRSIILTGPPGTGKTLIGRALMTELEGVTFAWVTPGGFDETGSSDPGVFFRWARKRAPAVLFFEDLDLVAGVRNESSATSLGEILAQMDGFISNEGLVVIATTNDVDAIDEALRRPGRFDRQLKIDLPSEAEREAMLARFLAGYPVAAPETLVPRLANLTSGLAGAHLRELVATVAIERAITKQEANPATLQDFQRALAVLRMTRSDIGFQAKPGPKR